MLAFAFVAAVAGVAGCGGSGGQATSAPIIEKIPCRRQSCILYHLKSGS